MAKSKLHPVAKKLGFKSNEEFYKKFPTQEAYEMAMGGAKYPGGGAPPVVPPPYQTGKNIIPPSAVAPQTGQTYYDPMQFQAAQTAYTDSLNQYNEGEAAWNRTKATGKVNANGTVVNNSPTTVPNYTAQGNAPVLRMNTMANGKMVDIYRYAQPAAPVYDPNARPTPKFSNPSSLARGLKMGGIPNVFPQIQTMDGFFSRGYENVNAPYTNGSFQNGGTKKPVKYNGLNIHDPNVLNWFKNQPAFIQDNINRLTNRSTGELRPGTIDREHPYSPSTWVNPLYNTDIERMAEFDEWGFKKLGGPYAGFGEGHPFPYQPRMPKNGREAFGMPTPPNIHAQLGGNAQDSKNVYNATMKAMGDYPIAPSNYRFPTVPGAYGNFYGGYDPQPWPPKYSTPSQAPMLEFMNEEDPYISMQRMGGSKKKKPCYNCGGGYKKMHAGGNHKGTIADTNQGSEFFTENQNNFTNWLKNTSLAVTEQQMTNQFKNGGNWIQGAVNPAHKGYCTPMSKKTCTPSRKALARRFKSGEFRKQEGGEMQEAKWQVIIEKTQQGINDPTQIAELINQEGIFETTPEEVQGYLQQYAQESQGQEEQSDYAQYGMAARTDINPDAMNNYNMYAQAAEQSQQQYNPGKAFSNFAGDLLNLSNYYNQPTAPGQPTQPTQQTQQPVQPAGLNFTNTMNQRNPSIFKAQEGINYQEMPEPVPSYGTTITAPPFSPYEDVTNQTAQVPVGVDPGLLSPDGGLQYQWDTAGPGTPMASMQTDPAKPYVPKIIKEKKKKVTSTGYRTLDAMIADYKATPENDPGKVKKAQKIVDTISSEFEGDVFVADAARIMIGKDTFDDPKLNVYSELSQYVDNTAEKKKAEYIKLLQKQHDEIIKSGEGLMPSEKQAINWQGQITSMAKQINEARSADSTKFLEEASGLPAVANPVTSSSTITGSTAPGYSWNTPAPTSKKGAGWFLNKKSGRIEAANYPGWFYNDKSGKIEQDSAGYAPQVSPGNAATTYAYGGNYTPHFQGGGPDTTGLGTLVKGLKQYQDSVANAKGAPVKNPTKFTITSEEEYQASLTNPNLPYAEKKAAQSAWLMARPKSTVQNKTATAAKKAVTQVQTAQQTTAPAATAPATTSPSGDYMTKKDFEEWKKSQTTSTNQQTGYNYPPQGGGYGYGNFGMPLYKQKIVNRGNLTINPYTGQYQPTYAPGTTPEQIAASQGSYGKDWAYKIDEFTPKTKNGLLGRLLGLPPRVAQYTLRATPMWNPNTGRMEIPPTGPTEGPIDPYDQVNSWNKMAGPIPPTATGPSGQWQGPGIFPNGYPEAPDPQAPPMGAIYPESPFQAPYYSVGPAPGNPSLQQFMRTDVSPYRPDYSTEESFPGTTPYNIGMADETPAEYMIRKQALDSKRSMDTVRQEAMGPGYREGGVYDLTQDQIDEILRNGGTIEYI